jgi:alpha-amylase
MGVLLQAFYQRGNSGVPSPADGDPIDAWWDHLAKQATQLRKAGFTAIWLPPVTKGASGKDSAGYDVFDDYDLGSKNQKGTVATHYGTREQLTRCVAVMRANGLDVYADLVENQRGGGSGRGGFTFRYADADGQVGGGRFPKDPDDFHPNVPQDPNVPGPDFSFGSDLAPINGGTPKGSVFKNLIDSADWLTRALDIQGYRLDDVKGQSSDFLLPFLNSKSMAGKFAVAEYFDGNVAKVQDWIFNRMRGRPSVFDFATRFTLASMCDNRPFNMAVLDHVGVAGSNPLQAVTFVENHDTDRSEPIFQNKMLAYAYILTSEGYPCVFYKDYSTDKFCFGLKAEIDNLIFIHEQIADGGTLQRFKDFDVFAYERIAGAHLLVGLHNNSNAARTITVFTGFGANVGLHDYSGHAGDVRTDGSGQVTITIPRNTNGLGYVCYSRLGIGSAFQIQTHTVTQAFEGAQDLDIKPAATGHPVEIGRIWCEANQLIRGVLTFDAKDWTDATTLTLELLGPNGESLDRKVYARAEEGNALDKQANATGWHAFRIQAANTPPANPRPGYTLKVTYTAPQKL